MSRPNRFAIISGWYGSPSSRGDHEAVRVDVVRRPPSGTLAVPAEAVPEESAHRAVVEVDHAGVTAVRLRRAELELVTHHDDRLSDD